MAKILKSLLFTLMALATLNSAQAGDAPATQQFDISQTVTRMALEEGVSPEDALDAIRSKAVELNMKFVGHQPLSNELAARGVASGQLDIVQFCNPEDARKMVDYNPIFAAYMPCRIALVEDNNGTYWLMMINLDMLIDNTELPPELKAIAETINANLTTIMQAGASGEF